MGLVPDATPRRVLAVANQKGGVGKSTTAVNVAAALAELDRRVLVVDLDPQGNATTGLGIDPRTLGSTMYQVLVGATPIEDTIEGTSVRNLFVAPASLDLAGAEIELVPMFSRERKLRQALGAITDDYDYIFIDCPPSLGLLTVNALVAANEVLIPIQCEYYALEGVGQLIRNVMLVQEDLNTDLYISTIVLVMYDARTNLAEQVAQEVRSHFGDKVCQTIIPRTVRLSEAPSFGQPITVYDPVSRGAHAYRRLARELVDAERGLLDSGDAIDASAGDGATQGVGPAEGAGDGTQPGGGPAEGAGDGTQPGGGPAERADGAAHPAGGGPYEDHRAERHETVEWIGERT
jgi:chromosome partitioning protein